MVKTICLCQNGSRHKKDRIVSLSAQIVHALAFFRIGDPLELRSYEMMDSCYALNLDKGAEEGEDEEHRD